MRVASLAPSNTEIVAFLGAVDALVGVDDWSDWPPAVEQLPKLGPDLQIDLDRVERLEPDLVLAAASVPGMEQVVERVQQRELPTLVLAPDDLDGVLEDVERVAAALGVEDRGEELVAAMREELARLHELTRGGAAPSVYWEWWPDPPIAAGDRGWMPDVLNHAGATGAFEDVDAESPEVTLEQVKERAPDVCALCWQGALAPVQSVDRLRQREGWETLEAVRAGRVLEMPEALYGRPGPRLVEGVRLLAERLHPSLGDQLGEPYAWVPDGLKAQLPLSPSRR